MSDPYRPSLPHYEEVAHLVRHVRLVRDFFGDAVYRSPIHLHYVRLYDAYMDRLNREFAPYAVVLAMAIKELEDAYPDIERPKLPERVGKQTKEG